MRKPVLILSLSLVSLSCTLLPTAGGSIFPYRDPAQRLIQAALSDTTGFERLSELCDRFGPRFSGTSNLERAIDWILERMGEDGLEQVHGEEVLVPRWVRGKESAEMLVPRYKSLAMLGLGGSVATPPGGIEAEVLVVNSFEDLEGRPAQDKIVVFNVPFTTYGETVQYRYRGASAAARAGAHASLIRSVGPYSLSTPHTGAMGYAEDIPRIPHAAITLEDAALLQRIQDRGQRIVLRLKMEAHYEDDVPSRNVVAELAGREIPEEVVVLGGHIDSWDVGQGAMDDAGGCVAAWEALRLLKTLGLRPRRTVRVVLWTNEENGLGGARAYHQTHAAELEQHVLAIESDAGVFKPTGFGFSGSDEAFETVRRIARLLKPIGAQRIVRGGGGADISPLIKSGVPGMGLRVDGSKYFWYHHTEADMIDKLDRDEFNRCVAALAVMAYTVADLPGRLPR